MDFISKQGIVSPTDGPTAGYVSLALEPNTAFGYASMSGVGGESTFRKAGKRVKSTPVAERAVFVLEIPKEYVVKHMASERGAMQSTKGKLIDKKMYDEWNKSDSEYYALTEIRLPDNVPTKFIKGFMKK